MALAAGEIRELLQLEPHPTCGFVREAYRSSHRIPASALPEGYDGDRAQASVLWFLVTADARMGLHRIRPDQMYQHYLGDPLEVLLLPPGGGGEVATVGSDLAAGMRPQLLIPGGTWHVSRLRPGGSHALLATTEWPGVEPQDVELADPGDLASRHPDMAAQIQDFTSAHPAHPLRAGPAGG